MVNRLMSYPNWRARLYPSAFLRLKNKFYTKVQIYKKKLDFVRWDLSVGWEWKKMKLTWNKFLFNMRMNFVIERSFIVWHGWNENACLAKNIFETNDYYCIEKNYRIYPYHLLGCMLSNLTAYVTCNIALVPLVLI